MRFALAGLLLMTTPQLAAADGRDYGEIPYAEKVACKTADDCVYVKGFCHSAAVNKRFKEQEREQIRHDDSISKCDPERLKKTDASGLQCVESQCRATLERIE